MSRWKEKRKPHCNKAAHANLETELEHRRQDILNVHGQLRTEKEKVKDLEGALVRASVLLETQAKQFEAIKIILSFFEPAKKISQNEMNLMKRV